MQKYVQDQFGIVIDQLNTFQDQYQSDQFEARNYISRVFELMDNIAQLSKV